MLARARKYLGVIWAIFWRDLKRIARVPVALLVVGGICLLPSVYAWYTVDANFNPYDNTGNLAVAVANEDAGATSTYTGKINIGDEVAATLTQNHELGWQFCSAEAAREGVESGQYYAAIIIPSDFSESFLSIFSGKIEQPNVEYYVNEKISDSAVKVTNAGATDVQDAINEAFKNTITAKLVELSQSAGEGIATRAASDNTALSGDIARARANIDAAKTQIDDLIPAIESTKEALARADEVLTEVADAIPQVSAKIGSTQASVSKTRSSVILYSAKIGTTITNASVDLGLAATDALSATATIKSDALEAQSQVASALVRAKSALEQNGALLQTLEQESATYGYDASDIIKDLQAQNTDLEAQIATLEQINSQLATTIDDIAGATDTIASATKDAADTLKEETSAYSEHTEPSILNTLSNINDALGVCKNALAALDPLIEQAQAGIDELQSALISAATFCNNSKIELESIDSQLAGVQTDVDALQSSAAYTDLLDFLGLDATSVASFMSSPVSLETQVVYPVASYGASVAPFFGNIALWVAGFLLMALVKIRVDAEGLPAFTPRQAYFGRLLLYLFLGMIQACIVCAGLLFIGVQCANVPAFFTAAIIAEVAYVNLMFALYFSMRHVGKALAVVLLIIQIPGSSGMFPIQMMPSFYQNLNPFLPFTYSIDAMREAIAGFYGATYFCNLAILVCVYVPLGLAIGLIFGHYSQNLNLMFDKKLGRGGIFVAEHTEDLSLRLRTRDALDAAIDAPAYRARAAKQARRFAKSYRKLAVGGWTAVGATFVLIVCIAAATHADANAKLDMLAAFIVVLTCGALFQVVIAYILEYSKLRVAALNNNAEGDAAPGASSGAGSGASSGASAGATSKIAGATEARADTGAVRRRRDAGRRTFRTFRTFPTSFFGKVRAIYVGDMRHLANNAIAALVAIGLILVPPMYAWLTTLGFWDPYANTDNLAVAVVNDDDGYTSELFPTEINAGAQVVDTLHENSDFKWVFVNFDQAMEGVDAGIYYAAIVIPADFSRDLLSFLGTQDTPAQIDYYVNQKLNPIAPHITGIGATTLQTELDDTFSKTLVSVSLGIAGGLGDFLNDDGVVAYAGKLADTLDTAAGDLEQAGGELSSLGELAAIMREVCESVGGTLTGVGEAAADANEVIADADGAAQSSANALYALGEDARTATQEIANYYRDSASAIKTAIESSANDPAEARALLDELDQSIGSQIAALQTIKAELSAAGASASTINDVEGIIADLESLRDNIAQAEESLDSLEAAASSVAEDISEQSVKIADSIELVGNELADELDSIAATLKSSSTEGTSTLTYINDSISEQMSSVDFATANLGERLQALEQTLSSSGADLTTAGERLVQNASALKAALDSGDIEEVRKIIASNSDTISTFLSAPATIDTHAVYPVANNGSSMSAFYTSLSLWIGAIFIVALTDTNVSRRRLAQIGGATAREAYLGRWLTFGTIAIMQALIVCAGNLWLLGVQCVHPWLYLLACIICAVVFSNLVYTLAISFGNIGKAIAIVLLVMQLAGSGGIFPIQMAGGVFQAIYPWLPFAHSMEALQSCIAGIYGAQYWVSIGKLAAFLVPSLLLGLVLRRPIIRANEYIERKLDETKVV